MWGIRTGGAVRSLHQSAAVHSALRASAPVLQKKKKGAGGKGGGAAAVPVEKFDLTTQVPVLLEKDAEQPTYKDDSEYPDWLWGLLEPQKTVQEQMLEGTDGLTPREMRRLLKHARRQMIKEANTASRK